MQVKISLEELYKVVQKCGLEAASWAEKKSLNSFLPLVDVWVGAFSTHMTLKEIFVKNFFKRILNLFKDKGEPFYVHNDPIQIQMDALNKKVLSELYLHMF